MSRIHLLAEEVASQVAAGEVVERPASVVKELVENCLDAQSKRIDVIIRRGGSSMIKVVDDGIGMDRDDALLCLERHATSKIRTGHDLAAISTLGFRGEAIPSIASVSRFRMTTCEHGAIVGTEVAVNAGRIEHVRDGGEAPGTQIEVRSLFYNLPARRKFLRAENTEASQVEHQLHLQAIGHPEVAFTYVRDDRVVRQLPPVTALIDRIRDLCGRDLAEQLIEVPELVTDEIVIRGFIGKAGIGRSNRSQQIVFLNGRPIENGAINAGLREGYHTALMKGQFPVTFLLIEMDPASVDVNVHPAKREVRFRDANSVRDAVLMSVRTALEGGRQRWNAAFQMPAAEPAPVAPAPVIAAAVPEDTLPLIPMREQVMLRKDWSAFPARAPAPMLPMAAPVAPALQREERPAERAGDFRILGVLGKLYVLMENASGLVLVDQHAAHERVLFEELRNRMEQQGVPGQRLLMPVTFELPPRDHDWVLQNLPVLQRMGIGLESFGVRTWKIDSIPQFLRDGDPLQFIRDVIDELRETSGSTSKLRLGEDVIATTVCRHAVKANDELREPELARLIQDLMRCELPYCCPHGRPTMIQMPYGELEKKFGRKV